MLASEGAEPSSMGEPLNNLSQAPGRAMYQAPGGALNNTSGSRGSTEPSSKLSLPYSIPSFINSVQKEPFALLLSALFGVRKEPFASLMSALLRGSVGLQELQNVPEAPESFFWTFSWVLDLA